MDLQGFSWNYFVFHIRWPVILEVDQFIVDFNLILFNHGCLKELFNVILIEKTLTAGLIV